MCVINICIFFIFSKILNLMILEKVSSPQSIKNKVSLSFIKAELLPSLVLKAEPLPKNLKFAFSK